MSDQIVSDLRAIAVDLAAVDRMSVELAAQEIERLRADLADYREVHADHQRLVRELDVLLNGEDGAAKQASLCDIVGQLADWRRKEAFEHEQQNS